MKVERRAVEDTTIKQSTASCQGNFGAVLTRHCLLLVGAALAIQGQRTISCSCLFQMPNNHNGAAVAAAGLPLQLIVASSLASCKDSKQATQQLYNLLATNKVFSEALQGCSGVLPVTFGPPATAEAAAAFAGWLAKYGRLAGSLELQLLPEGAFSNRGDTASTSQRSATELAIAAALESAAAGSSSSSSSSSPGGLCLRSCKLSGAGLDCATILQALPGSSLTSLDLQLKLPDDADDDDIRALIGRIGTAAAAAAL
ncbi:hypothetical protein OEZ86_013429 [Tetradesmus obliquus]|nr:hypothetical protein OEZ86_013429 [Tetradesmus obliquus]